MVAVEIRKRGGFPQPRERCVTPTSNSATGTLPEKHESLANNLAAFRNRTVKTADDQRHDNARIGELAMRYGQLSQLAPLAACGSSLDFEIGFSEYSRLRFEHSSDFGADSDFQNLPEAFNESN